MTIIGIPHVGLTDKHPAMASKGVLPSELGPKQNPFHSIPDWTPKALNEIEVVIGETAENTNDFTKQRNPNNRYWSSTVTFKYKAFESSVIKMTNCNVPYISSQGYGGNYCYATFNKHVGDAIAAAANKAQLTVQIDDDKLPSNPEQWWKTVNKLKDRFGMLDNDANFETRDMHDILLKTENGIQVSVDIIFKLKTHTTNNAERTPRSVFKLVAEASRVYLKAINQDIQPPPIESVVPTIRGGKTDVAEDALLTALAKMGL